MEKIKNYIILHPDLFTVIGLGIIFYFVFFHNIWAYALMDVDESRYVTMAKEMFHSKDFMTLYLNKEFFFEKPPLYFWGECLSFKLFGKINEFTARFPVALYGTACCYLAYIMGKKIISRYYGIIMALILATSLEYLILSKFAILDIVVTTCICFSVCLGMVVYFCRENRRKYYWWLFYFFSGLAVMAKGLPGFIIPFGSIFFISIISKKFKEIFKPIYFIPGISIFLLTVLPWHILMLKMHNPLFWNEYIIKHHVARFFDAEVINREQPFYFYLLTILWGFFPWIISCAVVWIKNITTIIKNKKMPFNMSNCTTGQRFIIYNIIEVFFILLFFSASGTKLITYILPIYLSLSALGGYVWWNYLVNKSHENLINKTLYITGGLFLLISVAGILTPLYLPEQLLNDIISAKLFCVLLFFATGLALILFTKRKIYIASFATIVLFMTILSAIATEKFFEIDYKFGQDDLMEMAKYAKENNISLTTFNFASKYSLIFYGEIPVTFKPEQPLELLNENLDDEKNMVIVKNKDMKYFDNKQFDVIFKGRKFSLLEEKGVANVPAN